MYKLSLVQHLKTHFPKQLCAHMRVFVCDQLFHHWFLVANTLPDSLSNGLDPPAPEPHPLQPCGEQHAQVRLVLSDVDYVPHLMSILCNDLDL